MSTTTNNDEGIGTWANKLRAALAAAPAGTQTEDIRARANQANRDHVLTVDLIRGLIKELPKSNKYAKPCERCGEWVEAGQGILERDEADTRWMVSHLEGECPVQVFEGVPEGRYAIDWDNDDNVKFYQVKKGALYAQASAELFPIKDAEQVAKVLDAIKADPKAASLLYGLKLGQCGVCGRTLTNQESREAGIGPICSGRMGW
jgi:hypothetical protein